MVNKKLFSVILATLVTVGVVGASSIAFAQVAVTRTTVVGVAQDQGLSDLVKYLNATNLTAALSDSNKTITVFAPNNAAFDKLGNTKLAELANNTTQLATILKSHVVVGTKVNLTTNGSAQTLAGNTLSWTVNGTKVTVETQGGNYATVITKNLTTSNGNGTVNVIDTVLVPPAGATAAAATASATAAGGFLGLPGFEAVYGVAGLLAIAYLVMRRRK